MKVYKIEEFQLDSWISFEYLTVDALKAWRATTGKWFSLEKLVKVPFSFVDVSKVEEFQLENRRIGKYLTVGVFKVWNITNW